LTPSQLYSLLIFCFDDLHELDCGDKIDVNRSGSEKPIYVWETKEGKRQIQIEKPKELDDIFKPCNVTQYVLYSLGIEREFKEDKIKNLKKYGFPIEFSPMMNEVSRTIKRVEGNSD